MTPKAFEKLAAAQAPQAGSFTLDHIAHFIPDLNNASPALEKLGFTLAPFSAQSHRLEPGGPLVPAGTGNRCIMLERGYLEFLAPTADTPVANQLRTAIERYTGVHSVIFGTGAPDADHSRLAKEGFSPLTPVALQRQLMTPHGEDTARFTVVRVAPGAMPEGRIQFCQHHTPQFVWQPQWVEHANRAVGLRAVMLCVENPLETAQRYARFTGLTVNGSGECLHIDTSRGRVLFCSPGTIKRVFNIETSILPWIAGYALATSDIDAARKYVADSGYAYGALDDGRLYVVPPPAVGGIIVFEPANSEPLNF